jgi:DNA-binding MarR family transcriptional regulator
MKQDREALIKHILKLAEEIYIKLTPGFPAEWLSSDITVAQLRVLLVLQTEGPNRMSIIAVNIGTALSTATGIVDNLVKKGLVLRDIDPQDRRLVICRLTPEGQKLMNKIWALGRFQMKRLLDGLDLKQLGQAAQVAEFLLVNI